MCASPTDSVRSPLARWLSCLFHPFVVVVPTMLAMLYHSTSSVMAALQWTALCVGFVIVPGVLCLWWKLRRGEYADADVSVRWQRQGIYLFGTICLILCLATLLTLDAPLVLVRSLCAAILAALIGVSINRLWKISAHMAAMGGCGMALFWVWAGARLYIGVLVALISLAIGWARVSTGNHTTGQVIAGWLVGSVAVVLVFSLLG
ncbi:MAG: hypothetical protein J7M34_08645 [Anaerolineae bacterium]|nr:hypothetical protein [Anaerolineae bacterium]